MKTDKNPFLKKKRLEKRPVNFCLKKWNSNKKKMIMIRRTILTKNRKIFKKSKKTKNKNY
jgi:hypothetical protein